MYRIVCLKFMRGRRKCIVVDQMSNSIVQHSTLTLPYLTFPHLTGVRRSHPDSEHPNYFRISQEPKKSSRMLNTSSLFKPSELSSPRFYCVFFFIGVTCTSLLEPRTIRTRTSTHGQGKKEEEGQTVENLLSGIT